MQDIDDDYNASFTLILLLSLPIMCITILVLCRVACSCAARKRRGRREVFSSSREPPRFAAEIRDRARKRKWPFQRPENRWEEAEQAADKQESRAPRSGRGPATEEASVGEYGTFADYDGVQATAYVDVSLGASVTVFEAEAVKPTPARSTGRSSTVSKAEAVTPTLARSTGRMLPANWRNHFTRVERIATTEDGFVDLMTQDESGKLVAVKKVVLGKYSGEDEWEVPNDYDILEGYLRPHDNIVQLVGAVYEDQPSPLSNVAYVFTAYCDGGDLDDVRRHWLEHGYHFPGMFILHVLTSISSALGYIHCGLRSNSERTSGFEVEAGHRPVLHRDIKTPNIFLRWSEGSQYGMPDVVLGDFGGAALETDNSGYCATVGYMAPELKAVVDLRDTDKSAFLDQISRPVNTSATDIFSFGVVLLELLTLDDPNQEPSDDDILDAAATFDEDDPRGREFFESLLTQCLEVNPEDRCTAEQLFHWSLHVKPQIAVKYAQGQRMPEGCWPDPEASSRAHSSRAQGNVSSSLYSRSTDFAPPRSRSVADDNMSQVSGFTDEFCWCPNHRSLSDRRPGPDCIVEK